MIFEPTQIPGAMVIRPQRTEDERGFFARIYCERELAEHGLDPRLVQHSLSYNRLRGTLRGMHFQTEPHAENKLVSCNRGAIYDVIIDLRAESPSYRRWIAVTLTADGQESLFVPKGCAHGFVTLADETTVEYKISEFYAPGFAQGVRFDDPAFAIEWPLAPVVISSRDLAYAPYTS
jgi:dTDP-4-dehydrorhamnose 3,5-epimerase